MDKVLDQIIEHYARRTGLNPSALSRQVWEYAFIERMEKCGCSTPSEYYIKWANTIAEQQHFFDRIVVLETWFFRAPQSFEYLVHFAFKVWYPRHKNRRSLRILSLPCSTGEEPYSIAIALVRAGFPLEMINIDAIDISQPAIVKAEMGIFGKNSFRNKDSKQLAPYFEALPEGYRIISKIKQCVHFKRENVFDYGFLKTKLPYDVIFCRNLLIYFHSEAQRELLNVLHQLLDANGVIIVGATEGEPLRKKGFKPIDFPRSSAFHFPSAQERPRKNTPIIEPIKETSKNEENKEESLHEAIALADQGEFEDAISVCLTFLKENGPDAKAYYLLGLIFHATNRIERSEEFFAKALYLEPEYHEVLVYLALISEAKGNHEEAAHYRERAAKTAHEVQS